MFAYRDKKLSGRVILTVLGLLMLLQACGSGSSNSSSATKTPAATNVPDPVSEGTPLPSQGVPLSLNNADHFAQLARLSCGGFVNDLEWSPHGNLLAIAAEKQICIYEIPSLRQLGVLPESKNIAFSSNGKNLLSVERLVENNFLIHVWSIDSLKLERDLKLKKNFLEDIKISPDSKLLATSGSTFGDSKNSDSAVYDFASGKLLYELPASEEVIFSPDGNLIAVSGGPSGISLFSANDGKKLNDIACTIPSKLTFNSKGDLLVASCLAKISIWSITEKKEIHQIEIEQATDIETIQFSQDGNLLFVASSVWVGTYSIDGISRGSYINNTKYERPLILWSIETLEPINVIDLKLDYGGISDLKTSLDGTLFAIGVYDVTHVWGLFDKNDPSQLNTNQPQQQINCGYAVVVGTGGQKLNVRDIPSRDGVILIGIPENSKVDLLCETQVSEGTKWEKVQVLSQEKTLQGWVSAEYLKVDR